MEMDFSVERSKRYRSSSPSASSSSSGESSAQQPRSPPPKFHRLSPSSTDAYTCYLPPTCSQPGKSTSHASEAELERHQLQFHSHVCRIPVRDHSSDGPGAGRAQTRSETRSMAEGTSLPNAFVSGGGRGRMRECGKIFPDERFLELHQTEVHDSIARSSQAEGKKIFECFIPSPSCGKKFSSPMTRRNHLKSKHQYPADYFFSITNHGLNQIIEQEGLGVSMIRPRREHPPRPTGQPTPPAAGPSKPSQTISPPVLQPPSSELMEVDELAGQLDSKLALAFVPSAVRRKGGAARLNDIGMNGA